MEAGRTWVPAKPWQQHSSSRWEGDPEAMSQEVQDHLNRLLTELEQSGVPCVQEL